MAISLDDIILSLITAVIGFRPRNSRLEGLDELPEHGWHGVRVGCFSGSMYQNRISWLRVGISIVSPNRFDPSVPYPAHGENNDAKCNIRLSLDCVDTRPHRRYHHNARRRLLFIAASAFILPNLNYSNLTVPRGLTSTSLPALISGVVGMMGAFGLVTGALVLVSAVMLLARVVAALSERGIVHVKRLVLAQWKQSEKLLKVEPRFRGWIADALKCLERLYSTFTLENMYSFEAELAAKHPNNHNIRAKIKQQLQVLRDLGLVKFVGSGVYRYKKN